jgi:Zn-dependent peptidase ImmA (M78 family)
MYKPIDFDTKKKITILTLKWCKKNLGINNRKRKKLDLEVTERIRKIKNSEVCGNYCFYRNKMTIHTNTCITTYDIISTVIHEYTHYLQSRNKYKIYQKNYYYSTNPYEKEAKRNETKYTKFCYKEIKSLIY